MGLGRRNFARNLVQGIDFEPEYQDVLDYASLQGYTLPSSPINIRNNNRVKYLKSEGIWDELDLLYIFDQESGRDDFAKINYKSPSNYYLTAAPDFSEPTFTPNSGFKGGTGLGFNTGWNASLHAINFINNDASVFFKGFDFDLSGGGVLCGARTGNNTNQIMILEGTSNYVPRIATTAGGQGIALGDWNDHIIYTRGSNFRETYVNGVQDSIEFGINGPGSFSNLDLFILCLNESGVPSTENDMGVSYCGLGSNQASKAIEIYEIMSDIYTP